MTTKISRQRLLAYIEKEQIAFQFVDGLIKFTQPENYLGLTNPQLWEE